MTNVENAKRLVESIEAHRNAFLMSFWTEIRYGMTKDHLDALGLGEIEYSLEDIDSAHTTCGTTMCMAGFAALHTGWRQRYEMDSDGDGYRWAELVLISPDGDVMGDDEVPWEKIGADFLGLDQQTACRLFHYVHNSDTALSALKALAEGEDPNNLVILSDSSNHCNCVKCGFDE